MTALAEVPQSLALGLAFALGAVVGSFFNVVIHRLPRGESIVRPSSRCPACGWSIPGWANVPILSYAALRGRCWSCGSRISLRYPAVEALTAVLFAVLLLHHPLGLRLVASWLLAAGLVAAAFIDLEHKIIPNAITLPGMVLGLAVALLSPPPSWLDAVAGFAIAGGVMWAVSAAYEWRTGQIGLGMGDVKLVAMLGCFLGLEAALGIMVLGSLLGLAYGAAMIVRSGGGRRTRIPFGPAIALAGVLHLFTPDLLPRLLAPVLGPS